MAFFKGLYEGKIDDKGRMVLPAKLKSSLPENDRGQMVLQLGLKEKCLFLHPNGVFEEKMKKISMLNEFREVNRVLQRQILSNCTDTELDSSGRFAISKSFLEFASLEKEVIIIGVGDRMELWSPEEYKKNAESERGEDFLNLVETILGKDNDLV